MRVRGSRTVSHLPEENIYGHTKKLIFITEHLNRYMSIHGKPISVLDFGCGNGKAVSQFLIQEGVHYYGVDTHEPSLNYARKHFANENAVFLKNAPEGIPFDVIVYADILEHLDDPVSILRQHCNLLKNGGIIIGSVPNGFGPFEIEKRLDKWFRLSSALLLAVKVKRKLVNNRASEGTVLIPYNFNSGHLQFFTKKSLFSTLQRGGFQVECFKNGAFIGAPLSEQFFLVGERIAKLNARVADFLPYWAVSTWYFTARKRPIATK